jgi:hypothetical protein
MNFFAVGFKCLCLKGIKKKFIMGIKRHDKIGWVKTGEKLGTGEYSQIMTQLFTANLKGLDRQEL